MTPSHRSPRARALPGGWTRHGGHRRNHARATRPSLWTLSSGKLCTADRIDGGKLPGRCTCRAWFHQRQRGAAAPSESVTRPAARRVTDCYSKISPNQVPFFHKTIVESIPRFIPAPIFRRIRRVVGCPTIFMILLPSFLFKWFDIYLIVIIPIK